MFCSVCSYPEDNQSILIETLSCNQPVLFITVYYSKRISTWCHCCLYLYKGMLALLTSHAQKHLHHLRVPVSEQIPKLPSSPYSPMSR